MLSVDIWLSIPMIGLLPAPSNLTGKKRSVNWRPQKAEPALCERQQSRRPHDRDHS